MYEVLTECEMQISQGNYCLCHGRFDMRDKNYSLDRTWCVEHTNRYGTCIKFRYLKPNEGGGGLSILLQTDQKVGPFPGFYLNPVRLLP